MSRQRWLRERPLDPEPVDPRPHEAAMLHPGEDRMRAMVRSYLDDQDAPDEDFVSEELHDAIELASLNGQGLDLEYLAEIAVRTMEEPASGDPARGGPGESDSQNPQPHPSLPNQQTVENFSTVGPAEGPAANTPPEAPAPSSAGRGLNA